MAELSEANPNPGDDDQRPLLGYTALTSGFLVAFAAAVAVTAKTRGLPQSYRAWDLVTVGIASHKLSRLIAKDRVTSFIRAPFTEHQRASGHGEVEERARGGGLRRATGELLSCPYCVGQWVTTGLGVGLIAAPELTRLVAFIYTAETVADFLQLAYRAAEDAATS